MRRGSPIVPFDLSKAYVVATDGVLPALDAHLLTNLPEKSIVILNTENDRTSLSTIEDVLYFVKATRTIYYYYSGTWYYVSGNPTGGNTSTASVSVSSSNEITADIKVSTDSGNIISVKSNGLYAKETSHANLATKSELSDYIQKELRTGSQSDYKVLSDYNFSVAYKNLLDNPSTIVNPATTDAPGVIKVGAGLTVSADGTLAVAGADPTSMVYSVNEQTGHVVLTKTDVGLGNVDNTSDANKPVSTAVQTELDKKVFSISYDENNHRIQYKKTENGNNFSIDLSSLVRNYTATDSTTIRTNVSNSNVITANLKISEVAGNQLQIKNDGIYVPASEDIDMSDYATKVDLEGYVAKVTGKGLSTKDFTEAYETKLNGLSNYTLPAATDSVRGGVIIGSGFTYTNGVLSVVPTSVNGSSGALTFVAGKNISIAKSDNSFTFSSSLTWNNTQSYNANEFCSYGGKWYFSKSANNVGHTPTNTAYWTEYSSGLSGDIAISDVTGLQTALDAKLTTPSGGNVGQVLTKTSNGYSWTTPSAEITVDSALSDSSTNPVQNKVVKSALDDKISTPSGGSTGQVLKKTASGVEWGDQTASVTVDSSLSDSSENPVQNKVIKSALDSKITAPATGTNGQFLSKTASGVAWSDVTVGNASLNYLLFKIPHIDEETYYHLYVQFSTTDTFDTTVEFNTADDTSKFKAFTGTGMSSIQSTGLNYIFSEEVLQLDIETIDSEYKYFRFHWTNDNGSTFDRFGYGNREAGMQVFDVSADTDGAQFVTVTSVDTTNKKVTVTNGTSTFVIDYDDDESGGGSSTPTTNKSISFTSSNSTGVSWNGSVATFTHNMNCIPIASIYDNTMEQALYGVKVVNANSVTVDFNSISNVAGTWKLILAYGCNYE